VVGPDILGIRGESFVQPEVGPPLHGDQVTKPLGDESMSMSCLATWCASSCATTTATYSLSLRDDLPSSYSMATCRPVWRGQGARHLSVGDQAPVLHRPGAEVRDGDHVLVRQGAVSKVKDHTCLGSGKEVLKYSS
jgi:hypothetical protein